MSDFKPGEVLVPQNRYLPVCECDPNPAIEHSHIDTWGETRVVTMAIKCVTCGSLYIQDLPYEVPGITSGKP